jgi:rfaE bifunctional protein nucleotidyltransferase chain/domain
MDDFSQRASRVSSPASASGDAPHDRLAETAQRRLAEWRAAGERLVFTNGVFDLLHRGHVEYLEEARRLGDRLVVGINTDDSVRRLKGPERPLVPEDERAEILSALECVDLVAMFGEDTPDRLIEEVRPDVLVKGGDWPLDRIAGRAFVESYGGRVANVPLREGVSTTRIVDRIREGKSALDPWPGGER